ncbi:MAG: hypothetical protein RJA99_906 [Pseudomonadota bacterium]|jgi:hypothetical protein
MRPPCAARPAASSVLWRLALTLLAALPGSGAWATGVAPLAGPAGAVPGPPWVFAGLPDSRLPATRFAIERQGGTPVLRVEASGSYGTLVHPLRDMPAGQLSWRWRVDRPLAHADLRSRQGDDVALKVCALFDMPRDEVPFLERQLLRLAERRTGTALPNATVCYVWDPAWPDGTVVPNAYSARVRYLTLGASIGAWQSVRRDLASDFAKAFGGQTDTVPRLLAIAVGADADNTGGESLGFIADLELTPGPAR